MLTLRQRILIITGVVAAVIIIIVLIAFLSGRSEAPEDEPVDDQSQNYIDNSVLEKEASRKGINSVDDLPPIDAEELYLEQLSRIFVERFSSFSNQNNNSHLEDVYPMVTASMASWLESQKINNGQNYEGITTEVFSSKVESKTEMEAEVLVFVRQLISKQNGEGLKTESTQKQGRVELIKVGQEWKINGFWWE